MRAWAAWALTGLLAGQTGAAHFQRQLDRIAANSASGNGPYEDVTLSASEANSYLAGPGAHYLPRGVDDLAVEVRPGEIQGTAHIDFDKLGSSKSNALLSVFTGVHVLAVTAHVDSTEAPEAEATVTEVDLDGQQIPNLLIDLAVRALVQPRYPKIGRHFAVALPRHARSVQVGAGWVTIVYQMKSSSGSK